VAKETVGDMKIGLYSPYIPKHFGGGEKHMLTSAWYLSQKHEVDFLIPSDVPNEKTWRRKYETLFGLDLSKVRFVPSALADRSSSPLQTWRITAQYDAFLYLTDGSLFFSGSKNSILHVQVPYTFSKNSILERLKLATWKTKNANSRFTKKVVEKAWNISLPYLHYPYVRISPQNTPVKKNNDILAVGRFVAPGHATQSKGQEVLLRAFVEAQKKGKLANSTLHLVGTIDPGAERFVSELTQEAKGYPIRFHHDISQAELEKLYDRCGLFWHAAGWGIDDTKQPEKVEHFGMVTIEAMARGCIPVVLEKGGSKEIITRGKDGFFFEDENELIAISQNLLRSSSKHLQIQKAARKRAEDFSLERFCETLDTMVGNV
jgi:glycosyltransferase involved in cell wall biosynthesis